MSNRSKKILELSTLSTASNTDIIPIIDDPDGVPVNKKITVGNLLRNVRGSNNQISYQSFTSSTSNTNVKEGQVFYDENYLYVTTEDGFVVRISHEAF